MTKLPISERPLQVLPSLARAIGLNEAIILQQLHYWLERSDHEREGRRWVYNTLEQWQEQCPFWSIPTIKRAFTVLRKPYTPQEGGDDPKVARSPLVLVDRFNRTGFDKTNWYAIDYEELARLEGVIHRWDQKDPSTGSKRSHGSEQNDPTYTRDNQRQQTENTAAVVGEQTEEDQAIEALTAQGVDGARDLVTHYPPPELWLSLVEYAREHDLGPGWVVNKGMSGQPPARSEFQGQ